MSKPRKIKTRSTADKLVDFRDRVRKHYTNIRAGKPSVIPTAFEFDEPNRRFATMILGEELVHHSKALERAEKMKQLNMEAQNA